MNSIFTGVRYAGVAYPNDRGYLLPVTEAARPAVDLVNIFEMLLNVFF